MDVAGHGLRADTPHCRIEPVRCKKGSHNVPLRYYLAMKKQTKQLKTLRLRKESLKILATEQQLRVHGGSDPWDRPTEAAICDTGPIKG